MIKQTIMFKNRVTLPTIAVYSKNELIQGTCRECFEIRFPNDAVTLDTLSSLADPENLSELVLTERDDKTNEITAQFEHWYFTIVTGMGMKTDPEDGSKFLFLSIARKSDSELELEQLKRDNEDIQSALMELAKIISEE